MTLIPNLPAGFGHYPVIDVDGRRPGVLTDFIEATTITVAVASEPRRLVGLGRLTDRGLEFHQQDVADADGTDARTWAISEDGDETFWAEPLAARVTPSRM
ncbi:MAG TPA: hypothetical protein VIU11_25520 [Nakamurella sp.]